MNDDAFPYWRLELDDGQPRRVRCAGCDGRFIAETLSPSGHCERCVDAGKRDAAELRAEAMRRP